MTEQAAFTPGPWSATQHAKFGDTQMYWVNGHTSVGTEVEADVRLIAAAPDLFEALELADATLRGANMNRNVVERKIAAALTKARASEPSK